MPRMRTTEKRHLSPDGWVKKKYGRKLSVLQTEVFGPAWPPRIPPVTAVFWLYRCKGIRPWFSASTALGRQGAGRGGPGCALHWKPSQPPPSACVLIRAQAPSTQLCFESLPADPPAKRLPAGTQLGHSPEPPRGAAVPGQAPWPQRVSSADGSPIPCRT